MADDFSNDINTTGRITIGGSKSGNFETNYDNDWFKVTLTAGTTYLFTLTGAPDGGGTLAGYSGLSLYMMGAQGYSVGYSYNNGTTAPVIQYTPQASGTYFVAAGASYGQTGTYTIKSTFPAADDYAAGVGTTGALAAEATASGAFQRTDDVDWFSFHADAGQITTFTADSGAGMVVPQTFYVYDSAGRSVSYLQAQSAFIAGLGGDYFVGVNANGQLGNYAVTMHVVSDDYSSDNTRTGTLYAGGQATGTLDYRDDSDRFRLDVQEGQFYTVTLSTKPGDTHQLGLNITDGVGGYVTSTSSFADGTLTARILASGTGTLSLNVSGNYDTSAGTAYTLKASSGEADDFGGTMASATGLDFGVPMSGRVQSPDDVDMFKVSLAAGVTYRVDVVLDSGAYNNGFRMTDSSGNSVSQSSYNTEKFFTYTPAKSGDFYLSQMGNYSTTAAGQGYTVTVSAVVDDFSANTATTGRLAVGSSAKGELEAGGGDADWYAISLNAGGYYWFSVDGAKEGGGTLSSYSYGAVMRLLDAKGTVLATSNGGYNATSTILPYVATARGTYYVEVSSPGGTGTYTVKARVGEVDDYGNDAVHATAMTAGAAVKGKLELTSDADVFKFTAEAGVTYKLQLAPGAVGGLNVNSYAMLDVSTGGNEYVYARAQYDSPNQITKVFEASHSGDYYFKVGTSTYGGTGTYVLSATSLGKDDFPATNLTTGLLAPDQPVQGVIGVADDHDWIKVHLDAGRTYVFDLQGTLSGGGTLNTSNSSVGMSLTSANGYTGVYSTTAAGEPRISYIASASGDYYLDVHGDGSKTGSYTLVETLTNGDVTPPHLLSSTLRDGATNVSPAAPKFTLTYDEAVLVGSGITLTDGNGVAVPLGYGQVLAMGIGKTLVIDPHINLKPGVTYTLSLPEGSVLDLAGNKVAGSQTYKFSAPAPVTDGTPGNDLMIGNLKGLKLNGGAGIDTVYYDSASVYYGLQLTHNADGSFSVHDYTQSAGDTLTGVERLLLSNSAMALDIDGNGGQAYRLYQAAFNRAPGTGLGFWMNALDGGVKLETVAQNFIDSAEFKTLYGDAQSNVDFVTHLYSNVLHRAPLQAGLDFWTHALDAGATRAQILVNFSESAENVAALQPLIGQGFTYTPYG
ncbi:DUF4214 domain-containing protein [Duganella sp. Dugasp56]|uniref:DUF4214 domain-containing protein n=1 Tax=Duganella sp. Dugasp56 TaxID=3243046 RepID=UPI0039B097B5